MKWIVGLLLVLVIFTSGCTQGNVTHFTGDTSSFALNETDFNMPTVIMNQSEITQDYEMFTNYVSTSYIADGWEAGYVSRYGINTKLTNDDKTKFYDTTQVILAFPLVDGRINTSTKFITGTEEEKLQLAVINEYVNFGVKLVDENKTMSLHRVYEPFGVGDNEFVYSFDGQFDLEVYGIVFTKGHVLEKLSIYGVGISVLDLKNIAKKAAAKI